MQPRRSIIGSHSRRQSRSGYTLIEMVIILVVISILVTMSVPSYSRTLEHSRADIAAANLRAIWTAQRVYWLEYQSYTTDLVQLRNLGLIDQEIVSSSAGYTYGVLAANSASFQAAAVRSGSTRWTGSYMIDHTGLITGVIRATGERDITPAFQ